MNFVSLSKDETANRPRTVSRNLIISSEKNSKICPSVAEKIAQNSYVGRDKNSAKFVNRSHEKNLQIRQSVASKNLKIFQSEMDEKIVTCVSQPQDETVKFANRPRKLTQNLIISREKKNSRNFAPVAAKKS